MASIMSLGSDNISTLLGGISGSSSGGSIYDNLGTFNSIRSGSYGKLLNTYYKEIGKEQKSVSSTWKKNTTNTAEQAKNLSTIKTKTDALSASAAELATTGSKSVFNSSDKSTDKAVEKVQKLVDDYNSTITSLKSSTDTRTNKRAASLVENTKNYESKLSQVGIHIKDDNTLSVDADKLKKASFNDLKSVFNGSGSFAATTAQKAARVGAQAALSAATSSTYTQSGHYSNVNVQNLFTGAI